MNKRLIKRVVAFVCAASLLFSGVSCVNEKYALTEENIDTQVQVFSEGLMLPLGNLDTLKMKTLLSQVEGMEENEFLLPDADGAYALSMKGDYNFSEQLNDLLDNLEIQPFKYDEKVEFTLESVDVSSVRIEAMDFPENPYEVVLSEVIGDLELPTIAPIGKSFNVSVGVSDKAPEADALELPSPDLSKSATVISVSDEYQLPDAALTDDPISLDVLGKYLNIEEEFSSSHEFDMDFTLPEGLGAFQSEDITLDDNARVVVSVELVNPFLHSGSITPDVKLDVSDLLVLEGADNSVVNFGDRLVLNEQNHYKAEASWDIESLVLNGKWDASSGHNEYSSTVKVTVDGTVILDKLKTTTRLLAQTRQTDLKVSIRFEDFAIEDVNFTLEDPIVIEPEIDPIVVKMETELPEQIKAVPYVTFGDQSAVSVSIKPSGLENFTDLDLMIDNMVIRFPEGMEVEGTAADNTITVNASDISNGFQKTFKVKKFNIPAPDADHNLKYEGAIAVDVDASASGSATYRALANSEDISFAIDVNANLDIADYNAVIADVTYDFEKIEEYFSFDLPDDVKDMKQIIVYPECTDPAEEPAITMNFDLPEVDAIALTAAADKPVRIIFPDMIVFEEDALASYNYDKSANSITLTGKIPSQIILPIEKLVINPMKNAEDRLVAEGHLVVEGSIAVAECSIVKDDIEKLKESVISIQAHLPAMEPSTVGLDSYTTDINEEIAIDFDLGTDLPEELLELGRIDLKDVYLDLTLDAAALPDLDDIDLELRFDVRIPDMIVINDERVDKETGLLHLTEVLDPETKKITVAPVRIDALDLTGHDLAEGISDNISLSGSLEIKDATLSVDDWIGKNHEILISAEMSSADSGEILVETVQAKVDYQIDPVSQDIDLSALGALTEQDNLAVNLDLNRFHIAFELSTNLSVPLGLDLEIIPYYGEEAGEPLSASIDIEAVETVAEVSVLKFWISDKDADMPAGYEFVELDLLSLLNGQIPDRLELNIAGGTDAEQYTSIGLADEMVLKADYELALPLEPGENFEIVYTQEIPDIPAVVSQILSYGNLALKGEFENSLPFQLELSFELQDSEGRIIELAEGSGKQTIPSRNLDGSPAEFDLNLSLIKKPGVDVSDISSMNIVVTANSGDAVGQPINENDYVVGNVIVVVPDGITMDLNELTSKDEE